VPCPARSSSSSSSSNSSSIKSRSHSHSLRLFWPILTHFRPFSPISAACNSSRVGTEPCSVLLIKVYIKASSRHHQSIQASRHPEHAIQMQFCWPSARTLFISCFVALFLSHHPSAVCRLPSGVRERYGCIWLYIQFMTLQVVMSSHPSVSVKHYTPPPSPP
jgi:hypothetical protein